MHLPDADDHDARDDDGGQRDDEGSRPAPRAGVSGRGDCARAERPRPPPRRGGELRTREAGIVERPDPRDRERDDARDRREHETSEVSRPRRRGEDDDAEAAATSAPRESVRYRATVAGTAAEPPSAAVLRAPFVARPRPSRAAVAATNPRRVRVADRKLEAVVRRPRGDDVVEQSADRDDGRRPRAPPSTSSARPAVRDGESAPPRRPHRAGCARPRAERHRARPPRAARPPARPRARGGARPARGRGGRPRDGRRGSRRTRRRSPRPAGRPPSSAGSSRRSPRRPPRRAPPEPRPWRGERPPLGTVGPEPEGRAGARTAENTEPANPKARRLRWRESRARSRAAQVCRR